MWLLANRKASVNLSIISKLHWTNGKEIVRRWKQTITLIPQKRTSMNQSRRFILVSLVIFISIDNENSEAKSTSSTTVSAENKSSDFINSQLVDLLNRKEIRRKRSFMDTFGIPLMRVGTPRVYLFASDYIHSLRFQSHQGWHWNL